MQHRWWGAWLGAVSMGALLTAACGGDGSNDSGPAAGSGSTGAGGNGTGGDPSIMEPLSLDVLAPPRIARTNIDSVCAVSASGQLVCRGPTSGARVVDEGPIITVAGSFRTFCSLHADGTPECSVSSAIADEDCDGDNCGQDQPPAGVTFTMLSAGNRFACGIRTDGGIECWGDPSQPAPPAGNDFVYIDTQTDDTCALTSSGQVHCWGATSLSVPDNSAYVAVNVGNNIVCALLNTGAVSCFGTSAWIPELPEDVPPLQRISLSGIDALCGLLANGEVRCWDSYVGRVSPPPGTFVDVLAGGYYGCGLAADDTVSCWGEDWGNGTGTETCTPVGAVDLTTSTGQAITFDTKTNHLTTVTLNSGGPWTFYGPFSSYGRGLLRGSDPLGPDYEDGLRFAIDDGTTVSIDSALFEFGATYSALGEFFCVPPGSGSVASRNGDELVLDLQQVSSLGTCPGTPVEGSIDLCVDFDCPSVQATGTLDGQPFALSVDTGTSSPVVFTDGTILTADISGFSDGPLEQGLLFTSPDGPFGGRVYCLGATSAAVTVGTFPDSYTSWQLRDLSVLPDCSNTGALTIAGCIR